VNLTVSNICFTGSAVRHQVKLHFRRHIKIIKTCDIIWHFFKVKLKHWTLYHNVYVSISKKNPIISYFKGGWCLFFLSYCLIDMFNFKNSIWQLIHTRTLSLITIKYLLNKQKIPITVKLFNRGLLKKTEVCTYNKNSWIYRLIIEVIEATLQCVHVFYRLIVDVIEATIQCVHVFYRLIVEVIEATIQCVHVFYRLIVEVIPIKHMYTLYCGFNHIHN
jgi:hypothetical protein